MHFLLIKITKKNKTTDAALEEEETHGPLRHL
jgi:hypothetical protein